MSSLQRTRSLRKPASSSTAEPSYKPPAEPPRGASPSRLPVKPSIRPRSAANTSTATKSSRPPSTTTSGRALSVSKNRNVANVNAEREPGKKESSSRHPPLSSGNRPQAAKARSASTVDGISGQTRREVGHTRAKSTVTTLTAATSLRPPSRGPTTAARQAHGRSASVDKAAPSTPVKQAATTAAAAAQPRLRPAFSTLQQHYSPAKSQAPKPLTSAILAPPSPSKLPSNIAASVETSKLQAELIQLHLLHQDALAVQAGWQASAEEALGRRFDQVSQERRAVVERERSAVEANNILALQRWARSGKGIEEKIQVLDELFTGLWGLSDPGGRYSRIVKRFESWIDHVRNAEEARHDLDKMMAQGLDALFIGELDQAWREECAGATRRLESWRAQLAEIEDFGNESPQPLSSVERMVGGARDLVDDMLAELHAMEEIEQQALAREAAWMEAVIREGDEDDDTPKAGAIWRVV